MEVNVAKPDMIRQKLLFKVFFLCLSLAPPAVSCLFYIVDLRVLLLKSHISLGLLAVKSRVNQVSQTSRL